MPKFTTLPEAEAAFADVELQAGLENAPSSDALTRLGHDSTILSINDIESEASYTFQYIKGAGDEARFTNAGEEKIAVGYDFTSSKAVWNHELRHRGFRLLRERWPDRESFSRAYGEDAALLLFDTPAEQQNEVFDRMHKPEAFKDSKGNLIPFEKTYEKNRTLVQDEAFMGLLKAASDLDIERGAPPRARPKEGQ